MADTEKSSGNPSQGKNVLALEALENRRTVFLENFRKDYQLYDDFSQTIESRIRNTLKARDIEVAKVTHRVKTEESLREKCYRLNPKNGEPKYNEPATQITDLVGVRVVTYLRQEKSEVEAIIRELFTIDEKNSVDKQDELETDKVGYLSVHYIVTLPANKLDSETVRFRNLKCEVQIRTVLEDAWASIFHDRQYKSRELIPSELIRRTNLLAGSLELLDCNSSELALDYDRRFKGGMRRMKILLNQPISRRNLMEYIELELGLMLRFHSYESIERMLHELNISSIRDFDTTLKRTHTIEALRTQENICTADQLIRCVLILYAPDEFFRILNKDSVFGKSGYVMSAGTQDFLSKQLDINDFCKKYNVSIKHSNT